MANIHFILQGKGGVGKSFVAITLAQYIAFKKHKPWCFDTDGINLTFHGFSALNVQPIPILNGNEIRAKHFDAFLEQISSSESDVIIDNGSSAFLPLTHHLIHHKIPRLLQEKGHTCLVHTVIAGGQAMFDTINGFAQLINQFKNNTPFVVWLNPYWGLVEQEGKTFEDMKAYKENRGSVSAIVPLPTLNEHTFGRDVSDMLQERLTFDEAIASPARTIITRQRLKMVRDRIFGQIDNAVII